MKKMRTAQHSFCLKVVIHLSSNPARPGLTSELVCLHRCSWLKFSSTFHLELIIVSSTGGSTSLPILADLHLYVLTRNISSDVVKSRV